MKRFVYSLLFLLAAAAAFAEVDTNNVPELWFPVGETLVYRLYWGVIPVGEAEFTSQWVEEQGRTCLLLRAEAKTTHVVAKIYPVDDLVESIVDPETFRPVEYVQRLKEGRHLRNEITEFDYESGQAFCESQLDGHTRIIGIDTNTRDVLTLAYCLRAQGLEPGEEKKFRVLADDKLYDLHVQAGKEESIKAAGVKNIPCLKVEPRAKFGAIFQNKGKVQLWFSRDARRLCTRMVGRVPLANVKAILVKVKGPGSREWLERMEQGERDDRDGKRDD